MRLLSVVVAVGLLEITVNTNLLVQSDSVGDCNRRVSYTRKRVVPYLETYRVRKWWCIFYKIKTRWNERTEYYTDYTMVRECCRGYKLDSGNVCQPVCDPPCVNGKCTRPNFCDCDLFYDKASGSNHVCVPRCNACEHGKCNKPYDCECDPGYQWDAGESRCKPVCYTNCNKQHAYCSSPNKCTCNNGYYRNWKTKTCEAICTPTCVHALCTSPNVCTCKTGYVQRPDDPFTCEPLCENACDNGRCVAPGDCRCDVGFVRKDNDTGCVSACEDNCNDRGLCVTENGTCECFYGWDGLRCNLPAFCLVQVPRVNEHLNEFSEMIVATYVNDTIASVFSSSPPCYQNCWTEISNETPCFLHSGNDTDDDTIACLMSTDSPCNTIS